MQIPQQYEPYLQHVTTLLSQIPPILHLILNQDYIPQLLLFITMCIFFLIGRWSCPRTLTHLLEMVNDAEITRKKISAKLELQAAWVRKVQGKRRTVRGVGVFGVLGVVGWVYLYGVQYIQIPISISTVTILVTLLYSLLLYFSKKTQQALSLCLQSTTKHTQSQIQQILVLLQQPLRNKLKQLYSQELQLQWMKQSKEQCKLYRCFQEKRYFEEAVAVYEGVIGQIRKFNMCEICLAEDNIAVQKLGINELDSVVKIVKKARTGKLSLEQKKEAVNRLLTEFQKMSEKLPHICKKGCCIKQRVLIEATKTNFYDKFKQLQGKAPNDKKQ